MQTFNLSQLNEYLDRHSFFIVDHNVHELYKKQLSALKKKSVIIVKDAERSKNISSYSAICSRLIEEGISRQDTIIAIGGGATTDLAGFVAATILRGINWVSVPTTLLGMVDASIGGKVGINTQHGKNLIGNFHFPKETLICEDFLITLSNDDVNSGKGEILKYSFLSKDIYSLVKTKSEMGDIIKACAEFKNDIVKQDPFESGLRGSLNLGHTFGHAIEHATKIPHGVCVALGLAWSIRLYTPDKVDFYNEIVKSLDISIPEIKNINTKMLLNSIAKDKKNQNGNIGIIIVDEIGDVELVFKSFETIEKDIKGILLETTYI